jgi:hypothetical protein
MTGKDEQAGSLRLNGAVEVSYGRSLKLKIPMQTRAHGRRDVITQEFLKLALLVFLLALHDRVPTIRVHPIHHHLLELTGGVYCV